jgi:hypothetical protein
MFLVLYHKMSRSKFLQGNIVGTRVNEMPIYHPSCESSERNQEQSVVTASCPVLSLIAVALPVPSLKLH